MLFANVVVNKKRVFDKGKNSNLHTLDQDGRKSFFNSFESFDECVLLVDDKRKLISGNTAAVNFLELNNTGSLSISFDELFLFSDKKETIRIWKLLLKKGFLENELIYLTGARKQKKCYLKATPNFQPGINLIILNAIEDKHKLEISDSEKGKKLINVFNSINAGIISTNLEIKILSMNPVAEKLTGWKLEQIQGQKLDTVFSLFDIESRNSITDLLKKVIQGNKIIGFPENSILITQENGHRQISGDAAPILNDEGMVTGAVLFFYDNSKEIEIRKAFQENEQQLNEAQTVAGIGNYFLDVKTGNWKSSVVLDQIFGIKKDYEKSVNGWLSLIHPDWKDFMYDYFMNHVIKEKNPFNVEYKIIRKNDNAHRWVHGIGRLEFDDSNNPIHMIGTIQDISDRKYAEEKLQESEQRYKALFNNSRAVMLLLNPIDGQIIDANAAACEYYGWSYDKLLEKNIYDISLLEPEKIKIELKYIIANARKYFVSKHRTANGESRDVEVYSGSMIVDKNTFIYSIVQDITERNIAEQALMENQARLQSIFSVAPVGIGLNVNRILFEVNETLCQMVGYSREELIGQSARILYPNREEFEYVGKEKYRQIAHDGKGTVETRFMRKDGKIIDVILSSTALDKDDLSKGVTFTALDITERRQYEKELNQYRQHLEELVNKRTEQIEKQNIFLRTLIDTIPNPVFVKNLEGNYTDVNKAFVNFIEHDREEIIGKNVNYFQPEETAILHEGADKSLLGNYGSKVYETEHIKHDGTRIPIIIYKASFGVLKSKPEGIVGLVVDVSKQKEMIEQTLKMLERERELNAMKTNFLSMASHEFRTPLTTILASADLIELHHQKWPIEKLLKHVKKIQDSVTFMTALLDDVLTLSRSERGKLSFQPKTTNIKNLCNEIIELVELNNSNKSKISFNYKGNIESNHIDPKLITHILTNLLSNSIKFTNEEGLVALNVNVKDQFAEFQVSDNGIGIHKEDIDKLFEPFFRGRNSSDIKGTGLGLSIVKRCVDLHNGSLKIDSEFGRGTNLSVKLNFKQN